MTKLTARQIAGVAKLAGFTGGDLVTAVAVALAESSGQTDQQTHEPNGTISYGLWQINSVHTDVLRQGDWSNPFVNASMALTVKNASGWSAWSTYKSGAYLPWKLWATDAAAHPEIISGPWPGPVEGALQGAQDVAQQFGITDIAKAVVGAFKLLGQAALWLANPDNWLRVAKFTVGGVLIVAGLNIVAKPVVEPVVNKAVKVAAVAA